jgi:hypothetical protein
MTVHNDDEQTTARFVLRVRRIEAHSLSSLMALGSLAGGLPLGGI